MILGTEKAYSAEPLERSRDVLEVALVHAAPFMNRNGIEVSWSRGDGSISFMLKDIAIASIHKRDGGLVFCDEVASECDGRAYSGRLPSHALSETIEAGLAHALWSRRAGRGHPFAGDEPQSPYFPYRG